MRMPRTWMCAYLAAVLFPPLQAEVIEPNPPPQFAYISFIAIDPTDHDRIYVAATQFPSQDIWRSDDAGVSWTYISPPGWNTDEAPLQVLDDGSVLASGAVEGEGGIYRSEDRGESWQRVSEPCCYDIISHPHNPNAVLATTAFGPGVMRSLDGGRSFEWLAPVPAYGPYVSTAVFAPDDLSTIYAATAYQGVFRSTDAGQSWHQAGSELSQIGIMSMVVDPTSPQRLFAGTAGNGLWRSVDGGDSWTLVDTGHSNGQIYALTFDASGVLYVGFYAWGISLMHSTDGGVTFQDSAPNLRDEALIAIEPHPSIKGRVYIGAQR